MAGISTYLANKLLDHANGVAAYTAPTTLYVALFDTTSSLDDLDAGVITGEIAGTGYARAATTLGAAVASAADSTTAVTFSAGAADWATARYAAVMDASAAGNVLYYGQLGQDRSLATGEQLRIPVGDLTVSIDASA